MTKTGACKQASVASALTKVFKSILLLMVCHLLAGHCHAAVSASSSSSDPNRVPTPVTSSAPGINPEIAFTLQLRLDQPYNDQVYPDCPSSGAMISTLQSDLQAAFPDAGAIQAWVGIYAHQAFTCHINITVQPSQPSNMKATLESQLQPPDAICTSLASFCQTLDSPAGTKIVSVVVAPPRYPPTVEFNCQTKMFTQRLDHFSSIDLRTFQQQYTVCAAAWPKDAAEQARSGNILLYIGNEAPLTVSKLDGLQVIYENAWRLNALVVAVEHRYFGNSQPFPTNPEGSNLTAAQLQWFTIPQVVEDTTTIITALRKELAVPEAVPVIDFGCSYGAMLSTYHRLMKPQVFSSAYSSSAALYFVLGTAPWQQRSPAFHEAISAAAGVLGGDSCPAIMQAAFDRMYDLSRTAKGRRMLVQRFNLCDANALPDATAGWSMYLSTYLGSWFDFTKMNTNTRRWNQTALACNVTKNAAADTQPGQPGDALTPLVKLADYFPTVLGPITPAGCRDYAPFNGGRAWAAGGLFPRSSWSWLYCGLRFSGPQAVPNSRSLNDMLVAFNITEDEFQRQCDIEWDPGLPQYTPATIMTSWPALLKTLGGVTFTNGQLDPWEASSPSSTADASGPGVNYVMYPGAGHCSDMSVPGNPLEPSEWKGMQRQAMDNAVAFAGRRRDAYQCCCACRLKPFKSPCKQLKREGKLGMCSSKSSKDMCRVLLGSRWDSKDISRQCNDPLGNP